jgi:hyperosmotically inducible protein
VGELALIAEAFMNRNNLQAKRTIRRAVLCIVAAPLLAVPALANPYPDPADPYGAAQMQSEDAPRSFTGVVSDAWITTKVKTRLIHKPGIAPLSMNVDTRNGIVTMFGSISTEDGKRMAGIEAEKVDGVKLVQNELQVIPTTAEKQTEKRDDQIRDSVQQRLATRGALHKDDIDVEVANGVVRLSGSVAQSGDRMIALSLARSTEGVRSVVDGLHVESQG